VQCKNHPERGTEHLGAKRGAPLCEESAEKAKADRHPFRYFVIFSSVLILAMWGYIIFGGQELPPTTIPVDYGKQPRVLLAAVDGALKRYAHYEGEYPELLTDLIPKYLSLRGEQILHLKQLGYRRDSKGGYRLYLEPPSGPRFFFPPLPRLPNTPRPVMFR
jgi:hypothetical protein